MTTEDEAAREHLLTVLRAYATAQSDLGRQFARGEGMHTTDAAAAVEILTAEERGRPLTPARLAHRIALTTGATSTLLNRLEAAGHIRRTRGHSDRRVVTLHSTPAVHAKAEAFFAPVGDRLHAALAEFSAAEIELVTRVVERLRETLAAPD